MTPEADWPGQTIFGSAAILIPNKDTPAMTDRDKPGIRLVALVFMFVAIRAVTAAPNLTGLWLTTDHDGIIKISNCGDNLCAEIAGLILDHPDDTTPVDYRGVSQCHLPLITDARPIQPNLWKGHIADPRNGGVYGVELHLDPHGDLALRGFLGISLLGRTQIWTRYTGKVPSDCRMHAGGTIGGSTAALPSGQEGAP
jgi:uncharacterized protein (DUF2147 family)